LRVRLLACGKTAESWALCLGWAMAWDGIPLNC